MPNINIRYTLFISFIFLIITLDPLIKTVLSVTFVFLSFRNTTEQTLMIFSLIQIIAILNPIIFGPSSSFFTLCRIIITVVPFILFFLRHKSFCINNKIFIYNSWFSLSLLIINIININNYVITVSLLKLLVYYCGSSFMILSFSILDNLRNILAWFYALCLNLIILSLIIYIFAFEIGVLVEWGIPRPDLFRGVFIHPNQVGIILIPFFILFLYSQNKKSKLDILHIFIISSILFLIIVSGARGGAAGLLISIIITLIISLVKKKYLRQIRQIIIKNKLFLAISLITLLVMSQSVIEIFNSFALKQSIYKTETIDARELFYLSRGWRILLSIENFIQHPLIGIGFGVPTSPEGFWRVVYDPIFNIPISAPVEKAFFFSGILEEFGLIGTISFFIFYIKWASIIIRNTHSIFTILLFFSLFTLSIFEFQFFSMGIYGFNWIWLGLITRLSYN